MTLQAVVAELSGDVTGIGGSVERRGMAVPAAGVGQSTEYIVHMTLVAGHRLMGADEREGRGRMGERGRTPDGGGVAGLARGREVRSRMAGIPCR